MGRAGPGSPSRPIIFFMWRAAGEPGPSIFQLVGSGPAHKFFNWLAAARLGHQFFIWWAAARPGPAQSNFHLMGREAHETLAHFMGRPAISVGRPVDFEDRPMCCPVIERCTLAVLKYLVRIRYQVLITVVSLTFPYIFTPP